MWLVDCIPSQTRTHTWRCYPFYEKVFSETVSLVLHGLVLARKAVQPHSHHISDTRKKGTSNNETDDVIRLIKALPDTDMDTRWDDGRLLLVKHTGHKATSRFTVITQRETKRNSWQLSCVYERGQKKCVKSTPSSDLFVQLFKQKTTTQTKKCVGKRSRWLMISLLLFHPILYPFPFGLDPNENKQQ